MLKRLRRQLISIIMLLVSAVLLCTLGLSFVASYSAQKSVVAESLQHELAVGTDDFPRMGQMHGQMEARGSMPCLLAEVELDDGTIKIETKRTPITIDESVLESVARQVVFDGKSSGEDRELHISWDSMSTDDGWQIAIADTTFSYMALRNQVVQYLLITLVALVALYAIAWWLSGWVLRPVEQAWEQQRRFVADASHELKTPLAVILANTQILERDASIGSDAMRWVSSTSDEAKHMKALVNDLLQLARADESVANASSSTVRHEPIDLSEMVEQAALEFDAIAFERGCTIESDVAPNVTMSGDPEWIERLVRILIDNACKYADPGTTVDVRLSEAGGHRTLSVHNMGSAIDPEDLPHVFERFYRSDKSRTRGAEGGFGLGLAIAKSITDAHGGRISVESTAQDGTTFTVVL